MKEETWTAFGPIRELAEQYPDVVRQETERVMATIVARLESEVVQRTPAGVGGGAGLRGSIHGEVVTFGQSVQGVVGTPLPYGEVVEVGRKPGSFPPVGPIALWVQRKLGIPAEDAPSVGFLVARKIAKEGTEGAKMFEKAWNAVDAWAMRQIGTIPDRVVRRLGEAL